MLTLLGVFGSKGGCACAAQIVRIAETREGFLDLLDLERQLEAHQGSGRQLIGCFSAASNITGVLADDVATTLLLHQYGALAFWDYAAAAPYVKLDMNPILPGVDETSVHKDAMFFSMHKFIGGVQTPGVLIAKKALFRSEAPNGCGGGTDAELREEGGTAAVVESVRAGLVMQLKETVGVLAIMAREQKIASWNHVNDRITAASDSRQPEACFSARHAIA
ncbi:Uncharacterized protein GBIM_17847 [Gryllus bimaculatus]|nr:Uncharacterized protein GBIM_17847 [Gryllus bimaculatus]